MHSKYVRLFAPFYASDIIVASPLGLKMIVKSPGDKVDNLRSHRFGWYFSTKIFSFPLLLHGLELSDTQVYYPRIRAPLGTASHF